ncbi:50S ribosomal protein L33 [symbiont of Argiope bruennichi]|uniref:50S ribosomal protein L33 n=1 Tax=symbiont of Argiope bruennichi TaxID=2810479 RepID=UPI003DA5F028
MRIKILLKCTVCGEENYITEKNKKQNTEKIKLKKFCWKCKGHTLHEERPKK